MTVNCLSSDAQFLYLDNELLRTCNELVIMPSSRQLKICRIGNIRLRLKQTDAGSLFFYNSGPRLCVEPQANDIVGKRYCNTTKQEFTFGKSTI